MNPAAKAHASIVLLEVGNAELGLQFGTCTGTIVGPRVVLTAAHCLTVSDTDLLEIDAVRVIPGKNGSSEPWGSQLSTRWMIPAEFVNPSSIVDEILYDWALILLPDRSMTDQTGAIPGGLAAVSDATFADPALRFAAVGYPYDCNDRTCGEDASVSFYGSGEFSWFAPASFAWASSNFLYHDADTYQGMSGGPVVRTSDLAVVGITSGMGPLLDRAVRITQPAIDRMNAWCQQNGCSINVAPEAAKQNRPHRAFAIAIATDSSSGVCVAERGYLTEFARASSEWQLSAAAAMDTLVAEDFNPESPEWRARFERAFRDFEAATNHLIALDPPDPQFAAYHAEVDTAVTAYRSAIRILKRAIDENTTEGFDELFEGLEDAELHFETAMTLYPGLDASCLAPPDSPFGPPPQSPGGR